MCWKVPKGGVGAVVPPQQLRVPSLRIPQATLVDMDTSLKAPAGAATEAEFDQQLSVPSWRCPQAEPPPKRRTKDSLGTLDVTGPRASKQPTVPSCRRPQLGQPTARSWKLPSATGNQATRVGSLGSLRQHPSQPSGLSAQ